MKYRAEQKCSALHRDPRCPLFRSLLGVKRTSRFALQMSAYDPKRTFSKNLLSAALADEGPREDQKHYCHHAKQRYLRQFIFFICRFIFFIWRIVVMSCCHGWSPHTKDWSYSIGLLSGTISVFEVALTTVEQMAIYSLVMTSRAIAWEI